MTASTSLVTRFVCNLSIILIMALIILLSFQPASALPRCFTGCTANDVQILGFSLVPSGTCTAGTTSADVYMHFITNRVNVYCIYVVFDIYTDGNVLLQKDVSVMIGDFNQKVDLNQKIYTISWPCGKDLFIKNIYVQWSQNSPCTYDCNGGTGSKCSHPIDTQVLILGIKVTKVVSGQCESGTSFPVSISGPGGYTASHSFDCSGGYFIFTNLPTGTYTITETVPTGWTATGSPQTVTVVSGVTAAATITNTRDTGSLTVTKVVSGQCESGTSFLVSISGPGGYTASHTFDCSGGIFTFTNLPTGAYTITETVPTGWTATGSPQTVTVSKGVTATATITNTRDTGSLTVTKVVSGQCESGTSFLVSISGPGSYSNSHTFYCSGGVFTFTNLPTGAYTITETVPTGWTATGSPQTLTVSKGVTATATITNTRDTGSLTVTKVVSGQCESGTSFLVSISGPGSYSNSHTFYCSGGSFTFTNLPTGTYTITETVPSDWMVSGSPQTVTVSKGVTATATITNTRDTGSLTVTKVVSGQCESGTSFLVSISGPGGYSNSHTFYCSGGVFTFTNLPTGTYTITETVPTGWTATGSRQTLTVSKGVTATATITNSKCQTAAAGADTKVCSGYPVVVEGSATDATSVSWLIKMGSGTLVWPYGGSQFKAAYTPPPSGENVAVLTFTAKGACPDVSDDMNIFVVAQPVATITVIEPPGWH